MKVFLFIPTKMNEILVQENEGITFSTILPYVIEVYKTMKLLHFANYSLVCLLIIYECSFLHIFNTYFWGLYCIVIEGKFCLL
jgi:hypothetical protein